MRLVDEYVRAWQGTLDRVLQAQRDSAVGAVKAQEDAPHSNYRSEARSYGLGLTIDPEAREGPSSYFNARAALLPSTGRSGDSSTMLSTAAAASASCVLARGSVLSS